MSVINSFEDLEVYNIARKFRNDVYRMINNLPKEEKYNLTSQMRRSALSITSNIAEGYGRFHYKENIQFCRQARGSLCELKDQIMACNDFGYTNKKTINDLRFISHLVGESLNDFQ